MSTENYDLLDKFHVDVYGNERSDFDLSMTALNSMSDTIALISRALAGLAGEMTTDVHAQVITAAHETLDEVVQIMNKALTILADCEVG